MVPWWRRLIYSIVAAAAGISVCTMVDWLITTDGHFATTDWSFAGYIVLSSIPGWVVGLPFALLVKRVEGLKFLIFFFAGMCIGPLTFLVEAYYFASKEYGGVDLGLFWSILPTMTDFTGKLSLAIGIAVLTTLIFLFLLRRALDSSEATGDSPGAGEGGSYLNLKS
jgi:hypothetical protein